jgi:hypothetical protein
LLVFFSLSVFSTHTHYINNKKKNSAAKIMNETKIY